MNRLAYVLAIFCCMCQTVGAGEGSRQWEVLSPLAVLRSCSAGPAGPVFSDACGRPWQLAMNSHGEGTYHPAPVAYVEEALRRLDARVTRLLACSVYVLPLPRRDLPVSSCDGTAIYLSPGSRPMTREEVHFLIFHEVGHLVHRRLLPDWNDAGWLRYRAIRGITNPYRFRCAARHADRPQEIFAEDFRMLFGSPAARVLRPRWESSAPPRPAGRALDHFFKELLAGPESLALCAGGR